MSFPTEKQSKAMDVALKQILDMSEEELQALASDPTPHEFTGFFAALDEITEAVCGPSIREENMFIPGSLQLAINDLCEASEAIDHLRSDMSYDYNKEGKELFEQVSTNGAYNVFLVEQEMDLNGVKYDIIRSYLVLDDKTPFKRKKLPFDKLDSLYFDERVSFKDIPIALMATVIYPFFNLDKILQNGLECPQDGIIIKINRACFLKNTLEIFPDSFGIRASIKMFPHPNSTPWKTIPPEEIHNHVQNVSYALVPEVRAPVIYGQENVENDLANFDIFNHLKDLEHIDPDMYHPFIWKALDCMKDLVRNYVPPVKY